MADSPQSVAITGATGFIGWHLAEAFHRAGWQVRAIVRPGNTKPLPQGVAIKESALESQGLKHAIDGCSLLVHGAGIARAAHSSAFDRVNVSGTRAAVDAANATGARLILISSQAAIGAGTIAEPAHDDAVPRPVTPYGRSKHAAEEVVRSGARVAWTIVRPVSVYGPRDRAFLPLFRMASRGLFLQPVPPSMPYTFIYVDDLAAGVVAAASSERARGHAMFLGHAEPLTANILLSTLAKTFGRPFRPWRVRGLYVAALAGEMSWRFGKQPLIDLGRYAELRQPGFVCSIDRARELLGFCASVSLTEGIRRTADWYRRAGWL